MASYLFPAGGRRGGVVDLKVGGLFLHQSCGFEVLGPGVETDGRLRRTHTLWFEGPLLPLPESQQAEDYPRDMAGRVRLAADAPLGPRRVRLWTAEGAAAAPWFVVGDLPEIVEEEIEGDAIPVPVTLPVTINGRIFPREDVDVWSFPARQGQTITAEVLANRIGSPLEARLEILDSRGRVLAESDGSAADPLVRFNAPADGVYAARIADANLKGGQAYVYRLTLTAGPWVDRVYPLGGRRGEATRFELFGQGVPATAEVPLPATGPRDYLHRLNAEGGPTNPVLLDLDDLPEVLEKEPNDTPQQGAVVTLPAVVNGRIDRPCDVDDWGFTLRKGEAVQCELRAAQLGSPLQGVLTVSDGAGKELARAEATPGQLDPVLAWTAPGDGTYHVQVRDRFHSRGSPAFAYRLRLAPPPAAGFRLRLPADTVTLLRNGSVKVKVTAERLGGFNDPITLAVEGLPPGVKAGGTLGAGQTQTDLSLTADAFAVIGAARLTVHGTATVAGKPATETARLATPRGFPEVDTLLLGVGLPAPFKVVADFDMRTAPRGTVYRRAYRIERNGFDGPIEVSLADRQARHLQGVTGPTLTIPPGVSAFEYPVTLPPWMETGRTCRVCIQASAVVKEGTAEHTVSYSAVQQNDQIVTVIETGRLGLEAERTSITAAPGGSVAVPVRVSRARDLVGPVRVELLLPAHLHGVTAEPLLIPADGSRGTLTIRFADRCGPFNLPLTLRATTTEGAPVTAETKVEVVGGE